jgi:hypothetical protein
MKSGLKGVLSPREFLFKSLTRGRSRKSIFLSGSILYWYCPGSKLGIDPLVHPANEIGALKDELTRNDVEVVILNENPIDKIWSEGRPSLPDTTIRIHHIQYAGEDH